MEQKSRGIEMQQLAVRILHPASSIQRAKCQGWPLLRVRGDKPNNVTRLNGGADIAQLRLAGWKDMAESQEEDLQVVGMATQLRFLHF
ncbi:GM11830 [Drosophila sechellia]|uniref:GM11830 n=1 Tax=Drosophila sechellia TaxID=7238 RepID=B4IHG4_DROSE|nr:GM11830 [Drosophila sechellia]